MDEIGIKGAVYSCNLGITSEERALKQIVILDITLYVDLKKSGNSDSIEDTINYAVINKQLRKFIESKPFCLIEKIAEESSTIILKDYPVDKVKIIIKKPCALKNAEYALVSLTRGKND